MSEVPEVNATNDEAALDAELATSIADIKAGNAPAATPQGKADEPVPKGEAAPEGDAAATGATGATGEAPTGEASEAGAPTGAEIRIPNKGKFESDEAYEKRIELFDLVKRRKAATTPEAKAALSAEISKAKGDLKTIGAEERFIKPNAGDAPQKAATGADPELAADQERLRQLGGATKEDVQAIIQQTQHEASVRSGLSEFVGRHAELKDEDVREVFFGFVESNYLWQGKSGKELATVLEMAYENMFRPAESVQDRVLKAAKVAEKVGAMQFPGGTGAKTTHSPEMQRSIDELKATGMSEDKAIELLSE